MSRVGSHLKCKRCGRARHRNTANGLCGRCWGEVGRPAIAAERAAVKARRQEKRAAALPSIPASDIEAAFVRSAPDPIAALLADDVRDYLADQDLPVALAMIDQVSEEIAEELTEGTPMPRKPSLNVETKAEVAEAYRVGQPIDEILRAYGIGHGALYRIIHTAGVPLRGQNNGVSDSPAPAVDLGLDIEDDDQDLPPPPLVIEPGVIVPRMSQWLVTYEVVRRETVTVSAEDYLSAATQAADVGADIVKVERL